RNIARSNVETQRVGASGIENDVLSVAPTKNVGVVTPATEKPIVAPTASERIVAIGAYIAFPRVVPVVAGGDADCRIGHRRIRIGVAPEDVLTCSSEEPIVAALALKRVVIGTAKKNVIGGAGV